jgi:hypothetical protein
MAVQEIGIARCCAALLQGLSPCHGAAAESEPLRDLSVSYVKSNRYNNWQAVPGLVQGLLNWLRNGVTLQTETVIDPDGRGLDRPVRTQRSHRPPPP